MSEVDASEYQSEVLRRHAAIMEYLQQLGFKPNPKPQVDAATQVVDFKRVYINPVDDFSI